MATRAKPAMKTLTQSDLFKAYLNWQFFSHACYNWERLQATGFAHTMVPIIDKLYTTKEDISAALKRHLVFFNTQPTIGVLIHGITIAMEEKRANGADISDEAINGLKAGLMGPLAGLGDTIIQALITPILLAIAIGWAQQGNLFGPIFYIVVMGAITWGVMWFFFINGYRWGEAAIDRILGGGLMDTVATAASIVGLVVAGVMTVNYVSVSTPITFTAGKATVALGKDILNVIVPGLLPLVVTMATWQALRRKVKAPTIILVIFIIGFVGGWLKILS
jgi:mannose PTS system EIID component